MPLTPNSYRSRVFARLTRLGFLPDCQIAPDWVGRQIARLASPDWRQIDFDYPDEGNHSGKDRKGKGKGLKVCALKECGKGQGKRSKDKGKGAVEWWPTVVKIEGKAPKDKGKGKYPKGKGKGKDVNGKQKGLSRPSGKGAVDMLSLIHI